MTEIAFEYLAGGLEAVHGTALAAPTHFLPFKGSIKPTQEQYRPEESTGMLAQYTRSTPVRRGGEWEGEGGADPNYLPFLANMVIKGGVTAPTTPVGATLARLWTFIPSMTSDDLKSGTFFFGDAGVQIWREAYCMADEMTISGSADSTDGVTISLKGAGQFPEQVSPPALPAQNVGSLLMPGKMQLWLDTGSDAIGTTEITGRVISAEATIPTGVSYKYLAAGPESDLSFTRHGRGKRHATLKLMFELPDMTQYDQWASSTTMKARVRFNGGLIEGALYTYAQFDIYGPFDSLDWGELASTNRTISMEIQSQYDATLGADFAFYVQNARTTL